MREFTQQDLANTAWAFAAANRPTDGSGLLGQRFARRCEELATEFKIGALCQLHQWALWHAGELGRSDGLPSHALLERCRAAFGSQEGRPSQMQRNVGVALASLGLRPEEEVVLHEGYSLDFVVRVAKRAGRGRGGRPLALYWPRAQRSDTAQAAAAAPSWLAAGVGAILGVERG